MQIDFYAKSLKGSYRVSQQDRVAVVRNSEGFYLFVVCDGMGGQSHGEIASKIAINTLTKTFKNSFFRGLSDDDIKAWMQMNFAYIVEKMYFYEKYDSRLKDMGTTCVLGLLYQEAFYVANLGDSRFYLFNNEAPEKLQQVTVDHNIKNDTSDFQKTNIIHALHDRESYHYTFWKLLTSSLTASKPCSKMGFHKVKAVPGYYFLTSDGLHDYVDSHVMKNILEAKTLSLKKKGKVFFKKAEEAMSNDNMSLILIRIRE